MIGKIFAGIGIAFGVLVLCMAVLVLLVLSTNNQKGNHQEILQSKVNSSKKALIVYQPSVTNISKRVAHKIAAGLNDGGYEVTLNYPGNHMPEEISGYQVVLFGSAAYWSTPSKALTGYLSGVKVTDSAKIVLYSVGGVPKDTTELDLMEKALSSAKPYKKVKFDATQKDKIEKTAYDLGKELSGE